MGRPQFSRFCSATLEIFTKCPSSVSSLLIHSDRNKYNNNGTLSVLKHYVRTHYIMQGHCRLFPENIQTAFSWFLFIPSLVFPSRPQCPHRFWRKFISVFSCKNRWRNRGEVIIVLLSLFSGTGGGGMFGDVNISAILDSFSVSYDKRVRPNYGGT